HAPRGLRVAFLEVLYAAAGSDAAHHLVSHADRVEHFEHEHQDVRRLDDVAAGIEHDIGIGRVFAALAQRRREALEFFGRQQQARDHARAVMELAVIRLPGPPHGIFAEPGFRRDPGHVHHEAGIHTVIARAHALATVGADLRPALRVRRPRPTGEEIEYPAD